MNKRFPVGLSLCAGRTPWFRVRFGAATAAPAAVLPGARLSVRLSARCNDAANGGEERTASRREGVLRTVEWLPALEARLAGLVHRSIDDPAERSRHERFLLVRLTAGAFALAAIPAYLAFRGVPRPVDAAVVLALAAQLGAALVLMRTGSLLLAHALASASYAGFIAAGGWGGMPVAAAALAAVPLDALMSGSRRSAAIAAAIALAALPAAAAVAGMGEGWPPAMLVAVLAAGFAAHAADGANGHRRLHRQGRPAGSDRPGHA